MDTRTNSTRASESLYSLRPANRVDLLPGDRVAVELPFSEAMMAARKAGQVWTVRLGNSSAQLIDTVGAEWGAPYLPVRVRHLRRPAHRVLRLRRQGGALVTWRLAYGDASGLDGLYISDQGNGWAEVVQVTDLDSAVGTTNLVEVTQGSVMLPTRSLHAAREALKRAWEACGGPGNGYGRLSDVDRPTARLMAFAALWEYGHGDRERSWVIATDREYSEWAGPDRWRVNKAMGNDRALHPMRVNGSKGLRRWLRSELDVEAE